MKEGCIQKIAVFLEIWTPKIEAQNCYSKLMFAWILTCPTENNSSWLPGRILFFPGLGWGTASILLPCVCSSCAFEMNITDIHGSGHEKIYLEICTPCQCSGQPLNCLVLHSVLLPELRSKSNRSPRLFLRMRRFMWYVRSAYGRRYTFSRHRKIYQ